MFKNIASGAILALLACALMVHGAERNIQEVLEERYKQVVTGTPELGALPAVASKEPVIESTTAEEAAPQTTLTHCKCQQALETPTRAEPEPVKVAKKSKEDKTKACKIESPVAEAAAEVVLEDVTPTQACEKPQVAVVEEKQVLQKEEDEATSKGEVVREEPVEKKSGKREKNKGKDKKRDKRDTKGGSTKSKSKSKSKRSSEGKSKNKDKKSRK